VDAGSLKKTRQNKSDRNAAIDDAVIANSRHRDRKVATLACRKRLRRGSMRRFGAAPGHA
jgi:hypothetical protein